MPFVKKNDSQGSQPPTDAHKIFIGRAGELLFFVQNILKPVDPTHNIISISGQGGVGKSTLLTRLIAEAHASEFKDYCLTAIVDERQTTPASIMEKFSDQLHMTGEFKKVLNQYKETLRKLQTDGDTMQDAVSHSAIDFAGAAGEIVPFVGPLVREGAKVSSTYLLNKYHTSQIRKDAERLEDPIEDLTTAFVSELNYLANTRVTMNPNRFYRERRITLFFDTFEQLAADAGPWLLNHLLTNDISNNVVLVIAGRDAVEYSTPNDPKRWLPYLESGIIYSISLNNFTEDETRTYLIERGVTDLVQIDTIWHLSRGLPLYLGLLTSNPLGKADPTKDVVDNFLRWIPEDEQIKRHLALDAALFSKPFDQDDLEALAYLPKHDLPILFHWLIGQPFVRSKDARYSYHELAKELFSRHLWQFSKKKYYATRRALADHYKRLYQEVEIQEGQSKEIYESTEWLELTLALTYQLFLLPDKTSHIQAADYTLKARRLVRGPFTYTKQTGAVISLLRQLSQDESTHQINSHARQLASQLLQWMEADLKSQEFFTVTNYLLEEVTHASGFSSERMASLYYVRGLAYRKLKDYQQAIKDFNHAIILYPNRAEIYRSRGKAYRELKDYQQAIEDFNHTLELNPKDSWAFSYLVHVYRELKDYQRAIEECDRVLALNPHDSYVYIERGSIYRELKDYQRAIEDYNHALELNPKDSQAYALRGWIYRGLKDYQRALEDFDLALELNPKYAWVYARRGSTYLNMKDISQAKFNYTRAWELDSAYINYAWLVVWCEMCQKRPDPQIAERLETIAATDSEDYLACICRGTAKWLGGQSEESLLELEQATTIGPDEWDAYFWEGMVCASLGRDEEAIAAIEKSLELELPPILLTPLRWLEQDRSEFYEKYVAPLLARYDL